MDVRPCHTITVLAAHQALSAVLRGNNFEMGTIVSVLHDETSGRKFLPESSGPAMNPLSWDRVNLPAGWCDQIRRETLAEPLNSIGTKGHGLIIPQRRTCADWMKSALSSRPIILPSAALFLQLSHWISARRFPTLQEY